MSPAHELALHLDDQNVGTFAGTASWSISVAREAVRPDDTITIYDTGGFDVVEEGIGLRAPTIQVRVRGRNYAAMYDKHMEIYDLLVVPLERTIGDHHYVGIWSQGDVADIGRDDNDRFLLTANYRINRQPLGEST